MIGPRISVWFPSLMGRGAGITVADAPEITGPPALSGVVAVGHTLAFAAAAVSGTGLTRTWELRADGDLVYSGTAASYVVQPADAGRTLVLRQVETNTGGSDQADSAASAAVAVLSLAFTGLETGNAQYPAAHARIGSHSGIGLVMSDGGTITARAYGSSAGGTQFGTAASPADFAAVDTGDPALPGVLHAEAVYDGVVYGASVPARQAEPVAAGPFADVLYQEDSAIAPLDLAAGFTGSGILYALDATSAALPAGLSLVSGQITGTPPTPSAAAGIVVRATSSGGTATAEFQITVHEKPVLSNIVADTAGVSVDTTLAGGRVYYLMIADLGSDPDAAALKAGADDSFDPVAGSGGETHDYSGLAAGDYRLVMAQEYPTGSDLFSDVASSATLTVGTSGVSYVDSTLAHRSTSGPSIDVPVPAHAAGDLMVLIATEGADEPALHLTPPAGFSLAAHWNGTDLNNSSIPSVAVWTKVAGGSEGANYAVGVSPNSHQTAVCVSLRGASGALQEASFAAGLASSKATPSVTGTAGSLLLNVWAINQDAITIPGTTTGIENQDATGATHSLAVAYDAPLAGGATTPRTATSPTRYWCGGVIEIGAA